MGGPKSGLGWIISDKNENHNFHNKYIPFKSLFYFIITNALNIFENGCDVEMVWYQLNLVNNIQTRQYWW